MEALNLADIEDIIRRALGDDPNVVAAYLFGSVARGEDHPGSDVDVAVLYRSPPPRVLTGGALSTETRLEHALRRPTELVVLNHAPVDLVRRVLRDGRIVIDADRSARIGFEVRAHNEYFDLLPHLHRYRRQKAS